MNINVLESYENAFYKLKIPLVELCDGKKKTLYLPQNLFFSLIDYVSKEKKDDPKSHELAFKLQEKKDFKDFIFHLIDAGSFEAFHAWAEKFPSFRVYCRILQDLGVMEVVE